MSKIVLMISARSSMMILAGLNTLALSKRIWSKAPASGLGIQQMGIDCWAS
jgi:hypothetical protein